MSDQRNRISSLLLAGVLTLTGAGPLFGQDYGAAPGPGCASGNCGGGSCGGGSCGSAGCGCPVPLVNFRPVAYHHNCPPPFAHCQEPAPCLKVHLGCPKPVCNPCEMPHYGYFQPCWRVWPYPTDWSHCPVPPPSTNLDFPPPPFVVGEPPVVLPEPGAATGGTPGALQLPPPQGMPRTSKYGTELPRYN